MIPILSCKMCTFLHLVVKMALLLLNFSLFLITLIKSVKISRQKFLNSLEVSLELDFVALKPFFVNFFSWNSS